MLISPTASCFCRAPRDIVGSTLGHRHPCHRDDDIVRDRSAAKPTIMRAESHCLRYRTCLLRWARDYSRATRWGGESLIEKSKSTRVSRKVTPNTEVNTPMTPDEPDQTTPSAEPTPEPTPSPAVEVTPELEPVVSSEPVEAPAEPVAEPPPACPAATTPILTTLYGSKVIRDRPAW
jgi:hypothetical protein